MPTTIKTIEKYIGKIPTDAIEGEAVRVGGKAIAKSGAFWQKQAPTFVELAAETGGQPSMQSIRDLVNSVGKGRLAGADKTARVKIMDAIKGDLEAFDVANWTNIAEALKVARDESYLLRRLEPLNSLFRHPP